MVGGKMSKAALASGALLLLAGCYGGVVVYEPVGKQLYADGDFENATLTGEINTRVYGAPIANAPDGRQVARVTTAAMKGAHRGPQVNFTATPTKGGSGGYHVVMLFNPKNEAVGQAVCYDPEYYVGPAHPRSTFLVSGFCFNDQLLSTASGSVRGVRTVDDPQLEALVKQVTYSLFPAYDHLDIGGEPPT